MTSADFTIPPELIPDEAQAGVKPETPAGRREGRAQEAAILDSLPYICFALDRQWRFTYLSRRAEQFFGHLPCQPHGPLLGRNILDECPEIADSTFARECQQALTEQSSRDMETFYPTLKRWFGVRICPGPDGVSVVLQDINERAGLQRALGKHAAELAEADRGKDVFLVQLAHEVRNALAPVRNALHLMRGRGLDDPEDDRACALAEQEVRRLSRLMDDLLKVAELLSDNVRLQKERVNLAEVVARSATAMLSSPAAGGRTLTVSLPPEPLWLEADPAQLELIITHLLDNAAKFTRSGGHIRLTAEREFGVVVLRVEDDGVGLSPELLPRIFHLFMRADRGPAGFQGGIGVGLTLVRRLVELHGGSVEGRSEGPGRGSEFVVRLPAPGALPSELSGAEVRAENGDRPLRTLVVDDSMDTAQILACILERWGHEVVVTYDGPQAIEEAKARRPDVVLLDIGMPGMDGYEVARHLREAVGKEKVVLVAVTGYGREEDRSRAQEAGFDYHMLKPVDPEDLKILLASAGKDLR